MRPLRQGLSGGFYFGGLAEWSKAAVLKTVEGKPSVGSNPTPTATFFGLGKTQNTLQPSLVPCYSSEKRGGNVGGIDPTPQTVDQSEMGPD